MIDFHSHILPNVDDGSKSFDDTIELLKEAQNVGFKGVIFTPHYLEGNYETTKSHNLILIQKIKDELTKQNIKLKLYLGNEIYLTQNIISLLESERACSINDTNYVLFEMPFNSKPLDLYDIVYDMLQDKIVPILAHPERYAYIQKDPNIVPDLIDKGVLMQCDYASIIGKYGKGAEMIFKKLLKNHMVHFLGSDVHKPNSIYKKMPQILKKIQNIIGKDNLEVISSVNPMLALENKRINVVEPVLISLTTTEKIIMNI